MADRCFRAMKRKSALIPSQIRISVITVNSKEEEKKKQDSEHFMLALGGSRQAFPGNGRKQEVKELFWLLNGIWQD